MSVIAAVNKNIKVIVLYKMIRKLEFEQSIVVLFSISGSCNELDVEKIYCLV